MHAKVALTSFVAFPFLFAGGAGWAEPPAVPEKVVLAIHGGAGVMARQKLAPDLEKAYRADLTRAL
jgi:hypothetical protein